MDNANPSAIKEPAIMPDHASIHPGTEQPSVPSPRDERCWPYLLGVLFLLLQGCATTPTPTVSLDDEARTQAKIAYLLNDYPRTLAIVLPRAEAGEAWAQYTLGYMYYYGRGVALDRQKAKRWIESAANKGYAPAQYALQRLSTPPSLPTEQNQDMLEQAPADSGSTTPPPAEPLAPEEPQMTESPPAPTQQSTPPTPSTPSPPPSAPDAVSAPDNPPDPGPESSQPAPVSIPPQTSAPISHAEVTDQPPDPEPPDKEIKGRAWISRQDPHHFTLQLASSLDEAAVIRLIQRRGIAQQAAYYATKQQGKTWYSLIYGSFTDRSSALHAMHKLPRALRRDSPRIRRFQEIQAQFGPTT